MTLPKPFMEKYKQLLDDQRQAVDQRDKNILISASAGTGKSHVLINRLVKRILDKELGVDEVVVMTFTEAAASELKEKLVSALIKNRDASDDEELKKYLNQQIAKIPNAIISTIHSFSLDIIKKHGYIKMLDPASIGNVMDSSDEMLFENIAMKKTLSDPEDYRDLLLQTTNNPIDTSKLEDAIKAIADKKRNYKDYDAWKKEVLEDYEQFEKGKLPQRIEDALRKLFREYINEALSAIEPLRKYAKEYYIEPEKKGKGKTLPGYLDEAETLYKNALNNLDNMPIIEIIGEEYKTGNMPSIKNNDLAPEEPFESLKQMVYGLNKNMKMINVEELINTSKLTAPYIRKLLELSDRYEGYYNELKMQRNLISFDDMAKMAIEILEENNCQIANSEYRNRYKEIMVDEYQDSSYEQERLIQLVSNNNNVFRVGDIKQSIYSFRNAKPQQMQGLIDNVSENDKLIHLSTNFRSGKKILDFSNYLFQYLFNIRNKNTYIHEEDLKLSDTNINKNSAINLVKVDTEEDETTNDKRKKLISWVVEDIKTRVSSGKESYGDFMILVRKNKYKEIFMDYLNRNNIPAYASFDAGFFNDAAVSSVVSLFKLIINQDDKASTIDVLRGPIYNYSDEEIAEYYLSEKKDIIGQLNNLLERLKKRESINDILIEIYKENNWYLNNITTKQRDNLDSLLQLIVNYQNNQTGLANLIEYLDKQKEADRSEATSTSTQDDVVQVMSIHQSKGLSEKCVYYMDFSDSKPANQDYVRIDEDLGICAHYIYDEYRIRRKNPYKDLIRVKQTLDEFDEEMRLLYVGFTRAEEELNIVYFNSKPKHVLALNTEKYNIINASPIEIVETVMNVYPNRKIDEMINRLPGKVKETENYIQENKDRTIKTYSFTKQEESHTESKEEKTVYPLNYNRSDPTIRGTIMHKVIELLKIRLVSEKDIDDLNLPVNTQDRQKIMNFYSNEFTKQLISNDNYHEYPYIGLNDNVVRNNIIDLLSIGDKDIYIIDFKSDKNTSEQQLIDDHKDQLNRYCKAIRKQKESNDRNIHLLIYSFDLDKYVEVPIEQ